MSATWTWDDEQVDLSESLTLVVASRTGKTLRGRRVEVEDGVATALRTACKNTLDIMASRAALAFGPDAVVHPVDEYLAVPAAEYAATDELSPTGEPRNLIGILNRAASLATMSAAKIPKSGFLLYAVVIGDDPEHRTAFIRKTNPRSPVRPGKVVTAFGQRLRRIDEPVFVLDDQFDLVVGRNGLAALNQNAFELLFRDIESIRERFPEYIDAITAVLPLADDGAERLAARCLTNSRLARKLRAIYENGHIRAGLVTIEAVREQAEQLELDVDALIRDGALVFDDNSPDTLLKLLNDDLFIGGLSKEPFEAGSKSRR